MVNDLARAQSGAFAPSLSIFQGADPNWEIDKLVALLARFEPLDPRRLYAIDSQSPLWLHLRVASDRSIAPGQLVLEFQTVLVDRYEVYQQSADGSWKQSAAGDRVAHTAWPIDSLRPRFAIEMAQPGVRDVYVRVVHKMPVGFRPMISSAFVAQQSDADQKLWIGLLMGVVFALMLSCAQMSWAYGDKTYAWYAGYLFFTVMAALSYSGVAHRMLWPNADTFSSSAIVIAVMAAFAFNLQFSRSMFGALQGRVFHGLTNALIAACVMYLAVTVVGLKLAVLIHVFHALCVLVFAFIIFSAASAWRKGVTFAGYWLLVYVPYLLGVAATLADSSGVFATPWLPNEGPIVLAILEAVAMMFCINAQSKLRHAQAVQAQVSAQHDPLTGFLMGDEYRSQVSKLWDRTPAGKRHIAVLRIEVSQAEVDPLNPLDAEALMARSVRVVRTGTREFDWVGRLGPTQLGVTMADVPPGEALTGRLQRIVALGLMRESTDPRNAPIRLRICVGQRHEFAGGFDALDAALKHLLQATNANGRSIQHLGVVVPVTRVGNSQAYDTTQLADGAS